MTPTSTSRTGALDEIAGLLDAANATARAVVVAEPESAAAAYEQHLARLRELQRAVARFEATWPGRFDVAAHEEQLASTLNACADHRSAAADHAGASAVRDEVTALLAELPESVATADLVRARAVDAASRGEIHEAVTELLRAKSIYERLAHPRGQLEVDVDLANVHEWLGDHARAWRAIRDAREVAGAVLDPSATADELSRSLDLRTAPPARTTPGHGPAGWVAKARGLASALERVEAAERPAREAAVVSDVVFSEARLLRCTGRARESIEALERFRPLADVVHLGISVDFHCAAAALELGDLDLAEKHLSATRRTFHGLLRGRTGWFGLLEVRLRLQRGEPSAALELADRALREEGSHPDADLRWKLQWRRGQALAALGRDGEAVTTLRDAVRTCDRLRVAPLGHRLDSTHVRDKVEMLEEAAAVALRAGRPWEALEALDAVKSRTLATRVAVPRSATEARSAQQREFDRVSAHADGLAFAAASGHGSKATTAERHALLRRRDELLEQIRLTDPRWRSVSLPAETSRWALGDFCTPGRVALVFHRFEDDPSRTVVALLEGSGVRAVEHRVSSATEDVLQEYCANLTDRNPDDESYDISAPHLGLTLQDLVPAVLLPRALAATTLVVVPHRDLHLVPWSTLAIGGGERLFHRCRVGVLPSLALGPVVDSEPDADPAVAVIGDARHDGASWKDTAEGGAALRDIAGLYGDRVVDRPLVGAEATAEGFWRLARRPEARGGVLHFHGHGYLAPDPEAPLSHGLVLTGGTLGFAEIADRGIPYREVVLSACHAGWRPRRVDGVELDGDDALGLPAALLESGASFVLVSIPRAHEAATRRLTHHWHRVRRSGAAPLQAYQVAQQLTWQEEPASISRWAGMTAVGCR